MKKILIAAIYTIFVVGEAGVLPFFWDWYAGILPAGAEPIAFTLLLAALFVGQTLLAFGLWMIAINQN